MPDEVSRSMIHAFSNVAYCLLHADKYLNPRQGVNFSCCNPRKSLNARSVCERLSKSLR